MKESFAVLVCVAVWAVLFYPFFRGPERFLEAIKLSLKPDVISLFLGGWRGPGAETYPILGFVYFYAKAFLGYFIITWVRLSMPRIRIDHMLGFSWKFLTPIILVVLMITALLVKLMEGANTWLFSIVMLAANILIGWVVVLILKRVELLRPKRQKFEGRPVAVAPKPPASANS